MTGLSCDHSSVEETLMAVLGWMPVSLSVCLPAFLVIGARAHTHILVYLAHCSMDTSLLYTYAMCTQSTNWWWRRHGALISALVPHHLLLMVVIN